MITDQLSEGENEVVSLQTTPRMSPLETLATILHWLEYYIHRDFRVHGIKKHIMEASSLLF